MKKSYVITFSMRFYYKYKQFFQYLLCGGFSLLVSIFSFALFNEWCGINELVANIFAWILATTFAFLTNKAWVFRASTHSRSGLVKQIGSFYFGRIATLAVEELIVFLFITCLHFPGMLVKMAAQVVVITLNYVISKVLVFR